MAVKPNPLVMALSRRKGPEADIQLPEPPRTLEIRKEDGIANLKPGMDIHLEVDGKVKSIDPDGRAFIEVGNVSTEDTEIPDDDEKPVMVRMQDSPSPGAV